MDLASQLRRLVQPWPDELRVERDEFDDLLVFARRDLLHLDADALNDRLHVWAARELRAQLPGASAFVSFRHARPLAPHEDATLDLQEAWHDLEPTLRLEAPRAEDLPRLAAEIPRFLALVDAHGRPLGYRRHDEGMME